jgi:WD40 repeat protein
VKQARISPDGTWVWALSRGKEGTHQVWNDRQAEPIGQLDLPAAYACHAAFTPGSDRLVITADREAFVWQLEPLEQMHQFALDVTPDDIAVTADGSQLIATMISSVRLYDLATGQSDAAMTITSGALVDSGLSADGRRLILAQQQRVLSLQLDSGVVEELIAYPSPHRVHLSGRLAPAGTWAAMQSTLGTVLYDLTNRKPTSTIAAGPMSNRPVISTDGRRVALGTRSGVGVWDTAERVPLVRFSLNNSTRVDLSSDGQYLLGYSYRAARMIVWEMPQ